MTDRVREDMAELFVDMLDIQLEADNPVGIYSIYQGLIQQGIVQNKVKLMMAGVLAEMVYDQELQEWKDCLAEKRYMELLRGLLKEKKAKAELAECASTDPRWIHIYELIEEGNLKFGEERDREAVKDWLGAWQLIKIISNETGHTDIEFFTALLEEKEDFPEWLEGIEMGLEACGEYEQRKVFCREVLDVLELDRNLRTDMRMAYADSFQQLGEENICGMLYKKWLSEDPENTKLIHGWCCILEEWGNLEQALELLEEKVVSMGCWSRELLLDGSRICGKLGMTVKSQRYLAMLCKSNRNSEM